MFFQRKILFVCAVLLALAWASPAYAGGWAVITLDELPSGAVAGEPLTVGFTVRQHGRTLMTGLTPKITAILGDKKLVFPAQAEGGPGHYTSSLTLPEPGEWRWAIEAFTMYQPMPALQVAAAGTVTTHPSAKESTTASLFSPLLLPFSLALLALVFLAAVIGVRRKSMPMIILASVCLLAGFTLLAVNRGSASQVEAQAKSGLPVDSSVSQVELGRQLFLAKGCITCHNNSRAALDSTYMTIGMGAPDLSKFSASPEALRLRLKDPTQVKSDTMMPNLELSESEIEALIAFINSK